MGLWLLGLLPVSRWVSAGVDPLAFSVARARDAVRGALRDSRPRRGPRSLDAALRAAVKDPDRRQGSKAARNYPRKKREKPPAIGDGSRSQTCTQTSTAGYTITVD